MSPSSFPLFPYLPKELRLQIWQQTCVPRVVALSYHPAPADTFRTRTRAPVLLHVSRESRAEGLRLYVRCDIAPSGPTSATGGVPPPPRWLLPPHDEHDEQERAREGKGHQAYFYLHPDLDTLYLPRPPATRDILHLGYADWARDFCARVPAAAAAARRIAIDYVPAEVRRPWEAYGKVCLLRGCPKLEEAVLVFPGEDGYGEDKGRKQKQQQEEEEEELVGAVELVEPVAADAARAEGIVERVRESFRYEVRDGPWGGWGAFDTGMAKDGCWGRGGFGSGPELIPRAKVMGGWVSVG